MDILKRTDFQQLVEKDGQWHVSIYMPTHRSGREQQQDPIRLKNLISKAEKTLLEYGVRRPDVQEMLNPAEELLIQNDFWQHQSEGLAVFMSEDSSKIYRLPDRFEELVVVSNSYHVQPVLSLLNGNGNFYMLLLNLNNVRLFYATRDNFSEVELIDTHTRLEDAYGTEEEDKNVSFHTGSDNSPSPGERPAMYYGPGVENERKEEILRFFRELDAGIASMLENESAPMVLVGVEYLFPLYHEANTYRNLLEEGVTGSPQRQDVKELHAKAWKVVGPIFMENQQKAIDRFSELHGQQNGLASDDLREMVKAAVAGRVETLLIVLGRQIWGRYDMGSDTVHFDSEPTPENDDLLNFVAVQTILNSGNVYTIPEDQFPKNLEAGAIFRYAL
jgi:hypothetical protein